MNDADIDKLIDKTHMHSTPRITSYLKQTHEHINEQDIKRVNAKRPKDNYKHIPSRYYYPMFANHLHAYQMDLLEQSHNADNTQYPKYYLILVNVNTRYAYALPLNSKSQTSINSVLQSFISKHKIVSITCDNEAAFTSKLVIDTLTANNISLRTVNDKRHTALSIIDRLIRTLRDMNKPTIKTTHQSDNAKYRDFSVKRMNKLLNIYNNTVNTNTGYTPTQMQDNKQLEQQYITNKLYELERKRKQLDFELQPDTYVRYIISKEPHLKKRYKVSPEAYKVSHRDGNSYVLIANDGTVKTISRWRLIPLGSTLPHNIKYGSSFANNYGTVQEILDYNPQTHKYLVRFTMPNGNEYNDEIPETYIRGNTPQIQTQIEIDYFNNHT